MTDGFAGTKTVNTFVAGLITEAGPLTFPENASLDESNCVLLRKGNRRRRKGIDYETDYQTVAADGLLDTNLSSKALAYGVWKAVAGNGTRNFAVVQINKTLYFYDLSFQALSAGIKDFTIDIGDYAAPGATEVGIDPVSITAGKGLCFIAGKRIDPFYIEYNVTTDAITVTSTDLLIRDFDGLDDGLLPDAEPTLLSTEHEYNLRNQGWDSPGKGVADPLVGYHGAKAVYPGNNKQWWIGKDAADDFSAAIYSKFYAGNNLAPKGRFLLDPFNKDRSDASGISGIDVETEENRPEFTAFFAGRVFYIGIESNTINGHIFFTQVVTKRDRIGKCYQDSDPTSEDLNELLPNDGGVIVVPEIGSVKGVYVTNRFLVIFADNGVWAISGSGDDSFSATNFAVSSVSSVGCVSGDSIINASGIVHWWSEDGIYRLSVDQVSGSLTAQSITQPTIETMYLEDIPNLSKVYSRGVYDQKTKRIFWHYSSTAPVDDLDRWKFDSVLIFDASLGVFYPWAIGSLAVLSPYTIGAIEIPAIVLNEVIEDVVDTAGTLVVTSGGDQITSTQRSTSARTVVDNTYVKWLVIAPEATDDNRWTFGEFSATSFVDWYTQDTTGVSFNSFLETGYDLLGSLRNKQTPFINFFFERVEQPEDTTSSGGCLFRGKWDWSDAGESGKWTTQEEIYPIKYQLDKGIIDEVGRGSPVAVRKMKVRGRGRALSLRMDSVAGKDFNIYGWEYIVEQNPSV